MPKEYQVEHEVVIYEDTDFRHKLQLQWYDGQENPLLVVYNLSM